MRYADSRPYALPGSLAELTGPSRGTVELPARLDWSEQRVYDLDDPGQTGLMYERVIREATSPADLVRYLDAETLLRLWGRMYLPARVRGLWENAFPALTRKA